MSLTVSWASLVVTGMGLLVGYSQSPGRPADPPRVWPAESRIPRVAGQPSLVMIAHPRCACTRASLGELAILMAHCSGRVSATVLFVKPSGSGPDWDNTDLWPSAAATPDVSVLTDEGGREARRFGAATSGQVVLYDAAGRLRFSGGITAARGHSGDNAGRAALEAVLIEDQTARATVPVFGCALFAPHRVGARESTIVCTN